MTLTLTYSYLNPNPNPNRLLPQASVQLLNDEVEGALRQKRLLDEQRARG